MRFAFILLLANLVVVSLAQDSQIPDLSDLPPNSQVKDYTCDENGYIDYLNNWTEEEKASSRNPSSDEFNQRYQFFKESCMKIHEWNNKDKYKMDFTYFADWSLDEFKRITSTTQRYSGIKSEMPATQSAFNNTSYRLLYPSIDPCDNVIAGGDSLRETINKPQNCSVSWAFAITNSIEYAVKKMYKEEYDQDINIALSAQELIDCAGKDHGIENGCNGIPVAWGFDYVFENGIAFRQYYPHTNVYGECKVISNEHKYHIAGYEKPEVYNKYGLFELLKKGPVAVTLGLDPEYFQFYQNDRENGPYFNTGYYRPSIYGVLLESNQYKENGLEEVIEWPYFTVETRLRACDSTVFRLPILESIENSNIGGIAGFAIRPFVSESVNENMIIPVQPVTECKREPLVITSDEECDKLFEQGWRSITVNEGLCNSITSNLTFVDDPCLESLVLQKNTLRTLNSLVISNNPQFYNFVTEDSDSANTGTLFSVKSVEFSNLPKLSTFTTGSSSFVETTNLTLSNLPNLSTFIIGKQSFQLVTSLVFSNLPKLEIFIAGERSFYWITSLILENLPNLSTFTTGSWSFKDTTSVTLSNLPNLSTFTTGDYSFYETTSLTLSNLPNLATFNTGSSSFYSITSLTLSNLTNLSTFTTGTSSFRMTKSLSLSNLTNLSTFITGYQSFYETTILSLSNLPHLTTFTTDTLSFYYTTSVVISDVPFTNGTYTHGRAFAFNMLERDKIQADDNSSNLKQQISSHLSN